MLISELIYKGSKSLKNNNISSHMLDVEIILSNSLNISREKLLLLDDFKVNDKIISRKILPVSLSYDHRIIDGAEGAKFCVHLSKCLGKDFAFKLAV